MKKIGLIIAAFCLCLNTNYAQNKDFVGRILYKNTFFAPNGTDITKMVVPALGAEQDYYTNATNYKSVMNGSAMTMQLYIGKTNKSYIVLPNKTATETDASTNTDKVLSVTHSKTDTLILGRKCKSVVIKTEQTATIYFYDPTLKVNKDNFAKHNYGNWNRLLTETNGALPVKYITTIPQFTWDAEAIKIEEMTLTDKDFELGADVTVKK